MKRFLRKLFETQHNALVISHIVSLYIFFLFSNLFYSKKIVSKNNKLYCFAPPVVCHEADENQHNYIEDEGRPFEVAVQAEISNH
ncbi:hypothetical protein [Leptospira noguchii]|uniref:hypothetical protein n=1 Tax=Leptospira noguchii TaxID=28182 RepID=UPI00055CBE0E|nr:hypothetical protein [Leptospira noguchii]UOG43549.1 hypothetical protein MAL05_18090 [Leptospira noguchii]UOG50791.1 hypothetical protein MAL00_18300 [Leptospira noguchii]UOG62525.1 hypothetical protein MAL07_18405 [Leptospira noguchii]